MTWPRNLFDELREGLEAIRDRPETLPRREMTAPDVKAIRKAFGMPQAQLATFLHVSPRAEGRDAGIAFLSGRRDTKLSIVPR